MMRDRNPKVSNQIAPIAPHERIAVLDVLRGFAMTGILFYNIGAFSGYDFLNADQSKTLLYAAWDHALEWWIEFLIQGKFYSLFSLLFGVGFALFFQRTQEKYMPFHSLYKRRLWGLAIIGFIHGWFIWYGDILFIYAILGFLLFLFYHRSDRFIWILSIIMLLFIPLLHFIILIWIDIPRPFGLASSISDTRLSNEVAQLLNGFKSDNYLEIFKANVLFNMEGWVRRQLIFPFPKIFGMFLLGVWAGRNKIFQNIDHHAVLFKNLLIVGGLVGIPMSAWHAWLSAQPVFLPTLQWGLADVISEVTGNAALCFFYIAIITLAFQKTFFKHLLTIFIPLGRLALSNYLLQSLLCIFIFYGIGGGLFMKVSLGMALVIALCIILFQIFLSHLWLRKFKQGPAEWLWRQFTYQKRFKLKRQVMNP